ncbi:protein phosphatase 1 regulatory subunit 12B isoform X2 [Tribolium castaneum]|uniref:protein phosphatase 1 regulatory subunit 12B isoform X2 n=1 Tax=Tribolium castaneum TaxID=7070 RepID=UPI00077DC517|nr:PREDICTED: protein phosphatase 1 regulatory subunit 12B isoform X2 [Tribolium castaneum]|eukprot:XP_015833003.1 PREDICTED: protein phosphatase 1 regulatory subunit 12B isoform X2 [Tribolium castaneum]
MSLETRSNSALFKRAEQLKRWEDSDTNREPVYPKQTSRKIKFSSGCVFLAACAAGDKDEVLRLLENGADINTANVDGLTALHQACIDDNSEMVEFLVEHGADVNRGDNEGWTPLHATASCGFLYIAKYLIEKGANVAAVNNDGELAVDIAECQKMEDLLNEEIKKRGIDCDAARNEEKRIMLQDAKEWLATKSTLVDAPHPKNGATALHVAAAKGYTDVMKILLQCGADIDAQDIDGWSPLHAAAHWGHKDACQILAENLADMDAKNYVGQTPFDLADNDMLKVLEDLKKKQNKEDVLNRRQAKKRAEIQDRTIETETPSKVKKVEVEAEKEDKEEDNIEMDVSSESESETESSSETESNSTDDEKKNRVNSLDAVSISNKPAEPTRLPPSVPPKQLVDSNNEDNAPSWRKQNTRQTKADLPSPVKTIADSVNNENDVTLRRPTSLQADKEFYSKYEELHARIKKYRNSNDIIPYSTRPHSDIIPNSYSTSQQHYRSLKEDSNENNSTSSTKTSPVMSPVSNNQPLRSGLKLPIGTNQPVTTTSTPTTPTTPGGNRLQMFKNFFKSFVPPVRDEESETQRKAHAKRVRETRRSTQGVTLEEIKSAEQFVKKKNQPNCNNNNNEQSGANGDSPNGVSVTATITTAAPTVITRDTEEPSITHERRPSWRLKIDSSSKFKLEDATKSSEPPSTPSFVRRTVTQNTTTNPRPSSAPVETAETTVTLPLRRPKTQDEKEQDKENDVRNAQATLATQAAIQRRRRPKRRSTGVVSFENMDDMDQDKDPSGGGDYEDSTKLNHEESDRSSRSRLGSTSDIRNENGEIDYKKLYEQALVENNELKDKLKKSDQELRDTKQTLEKLKVVTSKNSLSELEKRERRAMERKLSEMEEELKQLDIMKVENQKLKDENGALIRVISKLSK